MLNTMSGDLMMGYLKTMTEMALKPIAYFSQHSAR